MSECAIAHLRAFRQEFTVNDLIYATEKTAHVAEAVETGGLAFKGKPTQVYKEWLGSAESSCQKLVASRSKSESPYQVDHKPAIKVDYSKGDVAEQCWGMVRGHLNAVFQPNGIAECVHKVLYDHDPEPPPLRKVSLESLKHFAADIAVLLKVNVDSADDNVDDEEVPVAEMPPATDATAAALAVNLAQLAQQVPLSEAQGLMAVDAELVQEIPLEEFLPGPAEAEPTPQQVTKADIHKLVWNFVHPKSHHDVVECAVKLCTDAMFSRSAGVSLPDRRHGSIEQRWMAVDKCFGPKGASTVEADVVQRDDVVEHKGAFWRVCACFGKYYGRWSLLTEPAGFTDSFHLLLQRLYIDKACKPFVILNLSMKPMATIAAGGSCSSAGYSLHSCGDAPSKAKKTKVGADMWG